MSDSARTGSLSSGVSRGMTLLFAIAGGAAVGNLYWAQPLLNTIADSFGISMSLASLVVTVTQVGYAIGIFLLVPLGDTVNRRKVIPAMMLLTVLALLATGLAPSFPALLAAVALLGVTTVAGQFLTPLAGDLATDEQRGRVLGTVASGLMLGLLIARAVSGIVAEFLGWRAIYFAAAVLILILAVTMARTIPDLEPRAQVPYGKLLASVVRTVVTDGRVRMTMMLGSLTLCVFTMFWTGLTFLLAADPYSYSTGLIGLISLVGVAGAVAAQRAGRLYDRGHSLLGIGIGLLTALLALALTGIWGTSIIVVIVGIALFSIGSQSVQVLVQTRMLSIDPSARSRLNTVFIVANFIGGAIGGALAGWFWQLGGWPALMIAAGAIVVLTLLVWLAQWIGARRN
ncbi:MFS transporter [Brevibacterium sp. VCM10]|uniref:MFS transporter n=1 Tax=Brevibacterium sp. VCM10 TaxID=1381751 RepID=UPI00046F0F30|nr:MFS transporter [Brevibacterium sp. VCM10]